MKILLVEDESRGADFVKRGLAEEGHDVSVAVDGASALSCARAGAYDVIVLDVHLPDIDGFHVVSTLRAERKERRSSTLMATCRSSAMPRAIWPASGSSPVS